MSAFSAIPKSPDERGPSVSPESVWPTAKQAAGFMRQSKSYVCRLAKTGKLISRACNDGKRGLEIDPLSMPFDAQKLWREDVLRKTLKVQSKDVNRAGLESPQSLLFRRRSGTAGSRHSKFRRRKRA